MSFGEGNLHDEIDRLKEVNGDLCAEINRQERVIESQAELIANRDESIHNLVALLDKRQERIKKLEELVRDVRFCSNVPKCGVCPCLWDDGCSMEFGKRMEELGITEVDA